MCSTIICFIRQLPRSHAWNEYKLYTFPTAKQRVSVVLGSLSLYMVTFKHNCWRRDDQWCFVLNVSARLCLVYYNFNSQNNDLWVNRWSVYLLLWVLWQDGSSVEVTCSPSANQSLSSKVNDINVVSIVDKYVITGWVE